MTLEDVTKLFYFMTFIHKYHIFSKKVNFSPFFTRFGHFGGLPFFIFSKERLLNVKKLSRVHVFTRCACMCARTRTQTV